MLKLAAARVLCTAFPVHWPHIKRTGDVSRGKVHASNERQEQGGYGIERFFRLHLLPHTSPSMRRAVGRPIPIRQQPLQRYTFSCRPAQRITPRPAEPPLQRSAFDPTLFILALTLSGGIAYLATRYSTSSEGTLSRAQSPEPEYLESPTLAQLAQLYPRTMAPQMPPGRPGTLTADQEAKLKEMWLAVLDIFGVTHETHANGTATPSSDSTPDAKKKKKSRLSLFGKKDKRSSIEGEAGADTASGVDNDKHGQTKEFQQALASQSPESLREAFWSMSKHDHPDALLLRFLRARKWDVQAALVMMISTMHWRSQEMHVDDDIMINGEGAALKESKSSNAAEKKEGEDFMAQLRMGKSFLHGTDKEGRPCCWVRVRLHRQGEQSEKSLERFTVYTIETTRMMLRPPVDTAVSLSFSKKLIQG
jgi:hypothetical protein